MDDHAKTQDERIFVGDGLALRVLRRVPASGSGADLVAPYLLVHGLASNARLWDGVAQRLYDAGHAFVAPNGRHEDSARLAMLRTLQLFQRSAGGKGEA